MAIASSNPIKMNNKPSGIICKIESKPPDKSMVHANPAIIFSNVCPEVIFANSRIASVNTFTKYDKNSIVIKSGTIINGTFRGKNNEKKLNPWVFNPIILIPIKIASDKPNVNAIWLVTVKL